MIKTNEANVSTGEIIERDATQIEISILESLANLETEQAQAEAAKAHEKSALLAKLGITEDEAKLLLS